MGQEQAYGPWSMTSWKIVTMSHMNNSLLLWTFPGLIIEMIVSELHWMSGGRVEVICFFLFQLPNSRPPPTQACIVLVNLSRCCDQTSDRCNLKGGFIAGPSPGNIVHYSGRSGSVHGSGSFSPANNQEALETRKSRAGTLNVCLQ